MSGRRTPTGRAVRRPARTPPPPCAGRPRCRRARDRAGAARRSARTRRGLPRRRSGCGRSAVRAPSGCRGASRSEASRARRAARCGRGRSGRRGRAGGARRCGRAAPAPDAGRRRERARARVRVRGSAAPRPRQAARARPTRHQRARPRRRPRGRAPAPRPCSRCDPCPAGAGSCRGRESGPRLDGNNGFPGQILTKWLGSPSGPLSYGRAMPAVDAVVVSYNSAQHLRGCVEPLTRGEAAEVVVVDSASADDSLATVRDLPLQAVQLDENRGFAHACNVGWRLGSAPFVLFLNPDARLEPAALERLVTAAEPQQVGAVAPRIEGADGTLDHSLRRFPRLRSTYAQALFLHRLFPRAEWVDELVRDEGAYRRRWSPEWVSGACVLVRRTVLEGLGGLDDGFFLYCEDLDLCRRIRAAGFEIAFEPDAQAVHIGGASLPRTSLLPVLAASRVRYARK